MPTFRIVAKYQPKVDHELFGRFLGLVTSYRLKWTHDSILTAPDTSTKLQSTSTDALHVSRMN